MSTYSYTALNRKGELVKGDLDARSPEDVAANLLENGVTPVKINEKADFLNNITHVSVEKEKIPLKGKVEFYREFATMISAGLPLDQALDISASQTEHKGFKKVLNAIKIDVRGGSSLGASFGKYKNIFAVIEVNLIKSAEASGKLSEVLERLADDIEAQQVLKNKLLGALLYPAFVLIIAAVVIVWVAINLVPAMKSLYQEFGIDGLPLPTQILVWISDLITQQYVLLIILLIVIIGSFEYYRRTPDGKAGLDALLLKTPIVGDIIQKYQLVTFIKTYIMLISAGIPVINALNLISASLSNSLFSNAIKEVAGKIEKGVTLAAALAIYDFIPPILWRSIEVGQETGKTEEILAKIGKYYEEQVQDKINNLARLLEPILIVVLGGVVGFIAIAIYLPIVNFGTVIK